MPPPFIDLSGLGHSYAGAPEGQMAIRSVDLSIHRHEFVSVVGPSGCGKSTLLRIISGLLPPSAGGAQVMGLPITGPREDVGIVFQKPTLLPWLSVLENVLFPIRHKYGRYNDSHRKRAADLLAMTGLQDFANHLPSQLSGGMQQRVGIARALLLDPDILLMDEPFSALDALTREQIGFDLLRLWTANPKTVLFITHSISEAVLLSDRVVVMSKRPGTVLHDIRIDLPRPRGPEVVGQQAFTEYSGRIREAIYA